jgi:hypothetical protein
VLGCENKPSVFIEISTIRLLVPLYRGSTLIPSNWSNESATMGACLPTGPKISAVIRCRLPPSQAAADFSYNFGRLVGYIVARDISQHLVLPFRRAGGLSQSSAMLEIEKAALNRSHRAAERVSRSGTNAPGLRADIRGAAATNPASPERLARHRSIRASPAWPEM